MKGKGKVQGVTLMITMDPKPDKERREDMERDNELWEW